VGALRAALGVLLGLVARVWLATLRVHVEADVRLEAVAERPWVLAFWHGTQWPLLAWRRRRKTVVLVSLSPDGALQARALGFLGFTVVRGSSSRAGAQGLLAVVREMKKGSADAAFAVDGPRGPYGVVKDGAIVAARANRAVLVPIGGAVERGLVLARAWDRFTIAWPFSRVAVNLGPPLEPAHPEADRNLEVAINAANTAACAGLTRLRELRQAGDSVDLDSCATRER
jgi:lysophospholipid acyltransferase (LPLAT)-like uncharacterized protein